MRDTSRYCGSIPLPVKPQPSFGFARDSTLCFSTLTSVSIYRKWKCLAIFPPQICGRIKCLLGKCIKECGCCIALEQISSSTTEKEDFPRICSPICQHNSAKLRLSSLYMTEKSQRVLLATYSCKKILKSDHLTDQGPSKYNPQSKPRSKCTAQW